MGSLAYLDALIKKGDFQSLSAAVKVIKGFKTFETEDYATSALLIKELEKAYQREGSTEILEFIYDCLNIEATISPNIFNSELNNIKRIETFLKLNSYEFLDMDFEFIRENEKKHIELENYLRKSLAQSEINRNRLKADAEIMKDQVKSLIGEIGVRDKRIDMMQSAYDTLHENFEVLKESNNTLENELDNLIEEKNALVAKSEEKDSQISLLKHKMKEFLDSFKSLKNKVTELLDTNKKLNAVINSQNEQIAQLVAEKAELESSVKGENEKLKAYSQNLKEKNEALNKKIINNIAAEGSNYSDSYSVDNIQDLNHIQNVMNVRTPKAIGA